MNSLSNTQIIDKLHANEDFNGVYSKDDIPKDLIKNKWYVVNMQSSDDGNGSHWITFYSGSPGIYFDSFGVLPPMEILEVINKPYCYNHREIQNINTSSCGWFCISCIDFCTNPGKSTLSLFKEFCNHFTRNTKFNEELLRLFFHAHPSQGDTGDDAALSYRKRFVKDGKFQNS